MSAIASLRLRRVISRVDVFEPLSDAEIDRLVRAIGLELDAIATIRGGVVDFAKRGEPPGVDVQSAPKPVQD